MNSEAFLKELPWRGRTVNALTTPTTRPAASISLLGFFRISQKPFANPTKAFCALPTQLCGKTSLEPRQTEMNQCVVVNSKPKGGSRQLRKCFDRFVNVFYSLWILIVDFFPNAKRNALQSENAALRATLDTQKEVFSESLRRHDPLLQRILALEGDQESLRQENQRMAARGTDLKREAEYFRKVSQDHAERAAACINSKNAELCEMKKRYEVLEAEMKDLKNASSELQTNKNELDNMCTGIETEKRELEAALSRLHKAREEETSKWMQVVEQKTLENKAMDSQMSLLRKGNEQMRVEREETEQGLEELRGKISVIKNTSDECILEKEAQEQIALRLESEKDSLEVKWADQVRQLKEEISKHTEKIERQKTSLTGLHEALSQAKKDSPGLLRAVRGLKGEKADLKATLSRLKTEKSELETKLGERKQTIDLQRRNMNAWDACVAQNKAITDKLDEEKDELSKVLSQLQREKYELESSNQELKDAVNIAETRAVSAKAGLDTGYLFLEQMIEKQNEGLKKFLTTDAHTRDAQTREDLHRLKELMEENSSLLRRNEEFDRLKIQWETRARDAEQNSDMYQPQLQNSDVAIIAAQLAPHGLGL